MTQDKLIGRESELENVLQELRCDIGRAKRLISIYGLGGVGKSAFMSEVRTQLDESFACAILDENFSNLRDGRLVLCELSRQLNSYGVDTKHFKTSLTRFEDIFERLVADNSATANRFGRLVQLGAKAGIDKLVGAPVSEFAGELLQPFTIRANNAWQQARTAHRIAGTNSERELLDDPLRHLTQALIDDVAEYARNEECRFAFFVDTFEVVYHQIEPFLLNLFLPIADSSGIDLRLILAGRFPLSHYDKRWIDKYGNLTLQIEIQPFSLAEVSAYLDERVKPYYADISLSAAQLHASTAGMPFLLERWRLDGMSSINMQTTHRATFDRLTSWIDEKEREWLLLASCPTAFDGRLLDHIFDVPTAEAFQFLSRDESLCEAVSRDLFSVREPLRTAAIHNLTSSERFQVIISRVCEFVVTELVAQTECLLSGMQPNESRIKWLLTELQSSSSPNFSQELPESIIESLCILAATVPASLVITTSVPEESGNDGQAYRLSTILKVLQSVAEEMSEPGIKFVRSFFLDPDHSLGFQLLCTLVERHSGKLTKALYHANAGVMIRECPRSLLERAIIQMFLGHFKKAIHDLESALALNSADALCWATLGEVHRQQGTFRDACFAFGMAIHCAPVPDYVHAEYAEALAQIGRFKEAYTQIELACALKPYDVWDLSIRAYISLMAGNLESASEYFSIALSFASEDYSRACIAALQGNREQAINLLESALRAGIRTQSWARYDPDFRTFRQDPDFIRLTKG
jgi:Flp pilus assembly protein TadD